MATYCFGGGCESNGWMLVFYSTKCMLSDTIYNNKWKSEYIDCDFWLRIISIRPILMSRHWFEDDVILPVGSDTQYKCMYIWYF